MMIQSQVFAFLWKLLRLYWGSQPAIGPGCDRPK